MYSSMYSTQFLKMLEELLSGINDNLAYAIQDSVNTKLPQLKKYSALKRDNDSIRVESIFIKTEFARPGTSMSGSTQF